MDDKSKLAEKTKAELINQIQDMQQTIDAFSLTNMEYENQFKKQTKLIKKLAHKLQIAEELADQYLEVIIDNQDDRNQES